MRALFVELFYGGSHKAFLDGLVRHSSHDPRNIALARARFRVGNLYINRKTTGAIVGRQPFGGLAMSGAGDKQGGPHYVLQFSSVRSISENTLRRGFAPD